MQQRQSNFELLRIVAMLMVVLLHMNVFVLGGVTHDVVINAVHNNWTNKWTKIIIPVCFFAFCYCMFYTHIEYDYDNPRLLYNALTICLCIYFFFVEKQYMLSFLTLCILVIPILGSNTGVVKLCGTVCLIPLLMRFLQQRGQRKFIIICLVPLIMYMPIRYFCYTFYDDGIISLNSSYDGSDKIAEIKTSAKRVATITEVQNSIEIAQNNGEEVFCCGIHRHLFTYINDLSDPIWQADAYPDNPDYVNKVLQASKNALNIHYFVFRYGNRDEETLLEQTLKTQRLKYTLFILDRRGEL